MQILNLNISGNALNTNRLVQALSDVPTDLTGRTDMSAKLQITGRTKEQQIKSIKGNAKFTTHNGQLGVLGQFERYLQAQNILNLGIDNTKWNDLHKAVKIHNTSYFRRAEGEISFDNGYVIINKFKTQGLIMSLMILGKVNLLNEYADLNIYGKISDEIFGEYALQGTFKNDEIPDVLSVNASNPRGFKVNITGPADNIRSINSFEWLQTDDNLTIPAPVQNEIQKIETNNNYPSFLNEI